MCVGGGFVLWGAFAAGWRTDVTRVSWDAQGEAKPQEALLGHHLQLLCLYARKWPLLFADSSLLTRGWRCRKMIEEEEEEERKMG